jgi:hypothetical protein
MKIRLWRQKIRKGSAGTLDQQYFQQPQPPFLFGKVFDYKETGGSVTYEWLNKLMLFGEAKRAILKYVGTNADHINSVRIGFSYGL